MRGRNRGPGNLRGEGLGGLAGDGPSPPRHGGGVRGGPSYPVGGGGLRGVMYTLVVRKIGSTTAPTSIAVTSAIGKNITITTTSAATLLLLLPLLLSMWLRPNRPGA